MAFILFTGGVYSGKSRLAQAWAEAAAPERIMLATCHCAGSDKANRIAEHRRLRNQSWHCLEEPLEPLVALARHYSQNPDFGGSFVLDSLGMWINNLMSQNLSPAQIGRRINLFADTVSEPEYSCAVVSEEFGSGFLPPNNIARKYAAILGDANQALARKAHAVIFVSCGLPLALKGAVPAVLSCFDGQPGN